MGRAGQYGGKGTFRWSWDHLRSTVGNTAEIVTLNLLAAMSNSLLGEIWRHNKFIQAVSCLKISFFLLLETQ